MNAEYYAEFLTKLGHDVIKTDKSYWYEVSRFSYLSFPFHKLISLTNEEVSNFWKSSSALILRYPTPLQLTGYPSYRLSCREKNYDLTSLSKKARNQTRRGLENCTIQQVDFSYLRQYGFELFTSTLVRQGRRIPDNLSNQWTHYCDTAGKTPGFESWAALINGDLAAYSIGLTMDSCFNIFIQRSSHKHLKSYPNNALVFKLTQNILERSHIHEVSFGLESLQKDLESLDHFKIGMGYEKFPIKQQVQFRSPVSTIASIIYPLIAKSSTVLEKEILQKLEGAIRFYLEKK